MLAAVFIWLEEPVKDWKSFKIHEFHMNKQEIHPDVWERRKAEDELVVLNRNLHLHTAAKDS